MSKSRNVRSRYQVAPHYVNASIREKDSSIRLRTRDQRADSKRITRAIIESILKDTGDEA